MTEDNGVRLPHFNAASKIFKAIAKLVDFGNDAVQLWLQLLGREPGGSVPDGRDEGTTC